MKIVPGQVVCPFGRKKQIQTFSIARSELGEDGIEVILSCTFIEHAASTQLREHSTKQRLNNSSQIRC